MISFGFLVDSYPLLMQGVWVTLWLCLSCMCVSLSFGIVWGIARCNRLRLPVLGGILDGITFVLRGVPFYVQLLIVYYVLPDLLGINLPAEAAAILSLGLCSAAYVSQSVRAGINAIPAGQWEAAFVLGYSTVKTLWYTIIPQMMRNVLPMITGELDQLLKSTSIVSSIGVLELTRAGMNIIAREMNPLPVYLLLAVLYLMASALLNACSSKLERRLYGTR